MARPGQFQKGNTVGVGNRGPWGGRPVTSAIIQKLNEINKQTSRAFIFDLVDELFVQALPRKLKKAGKTVEVRGDLRAIEEIISRVDGRPVQAHDVKTKGKVTLVFEKDEEAI